MNEKLLKMKMIEKETNIMQLSKIINVNQATLYRYLKNGNLPIKKALDIKNALDLDSETTISIFFTH